VNGGPRLNRQQQVAERLRMARTTLVAIEKGERRLKPQELIDLASLLEQSVSDLLQRGAPAEGFAVQLRGAVPPSAAAETGLLLHIEEFQKLCEDYVRLEELCQTPLRRRYPPSTRSRGSTPKWRRRTSPLRSEAVWTWERGRW
jgi:DNA-binding XRE family transcriptional regulator